jgi:hypothetical protein
VYEFYIYAFQKNGPTKFFSPKVTFTQKCGTASVTAADFRWKVEAAPTSIALEKDAAGVLTYHAVV